MAAKSNELKITRLYNAPVKLVWDAWTDPKKAAKWWGPRGFTIITHSKDLRPGGTWDYTMHGPTGEEFHNITKYLEVEKHSKLVYDHGGNPNRPPLFRVTVLFEEINGKTKMNMTMALPTPEAAEEIEKFIYKARGYSTWDRLAEYLDKETSDKESFVINRSFDAPIKLMFEMWTNPDHFSKWLSPKGFEMSFIRADIKPGGTSFYFMAGQGIKMYGRVEYVEINSPSRIIYKQQFCDEKENLSTHPMLTVWPPTMLTVVTFTEESQNKTRVTVEWTPFGKASAEEIKAFIDLRPGMTEGWTGSFEKLDAYLNTIK